jgi:hypothetical protein
MESQRIKAMLLAIAVSVCAHLSAQKIWDERAGCISAQGNLAPGYLLEQKSVGAYVDGDVELFIDDRFACTGAVWASFATTSKDEIGLRANHALFWGANYHFLKPGRFDPYIGFTPGLGLVRATYQNGGEVSLAPFTVAPLAGLTVGCNYYVGSIFHFFVRVEGVVGQMFGTLPSPKRIDEIKFMGGLAFNLRLWKPKKHDTWGKTG